MKEHFKGIVKGEVVRYELPNIHALNFVMYAALGGGVTRSLSVDMHGKGLCSATCWTWRSDPPELSPDLPDPPGLNGSI